MCNGLSGTRIRGRTYYKWQLTFSLVVALISRSKLYLCYKRIKVCFTDLLNIPSTHLRFLPWFYNLIWFIICSVRTVICTVQWKIQKRKYHFIRIISNFVGFISLMTDSIRNLIINSSNLQKSHTHRVVEPLIVNFFLIWSRCVWYTIWKNSSKRHLVGDVNCFTLKRRATNCSHLQRIF